MKKHYKFLLMLPLVIVLAGCISQSGPDAKRAVELKNTESSGQIEVVNNDIDLGDIVITGGKVDANFIFKNTGEEPVVIKGGATSCMCTEAVIRKSDGTESARMKMPGHGPAPAIAMLINPGEEVELIATFDPMAHGPNSIGPITRDIMIETTSTETPQVQFNFQGNVVK